MTELNNQPRAPRTNQGARGWLADFYGDTGAYVAAWCRLWSLVWSAFTSVMLVVAAAGLDAGWLVPALAGAAVTAAHVWIGFFYLANPEWGNDADGDA